MLRFTLIPEVHLLLIRDNRVLLLRRNNTGYHDGDFSVIAGHPDGNETLRDAMAREAIEEAGIYINPTDLKLVHAIHRKSDGERVSFFFETLAWQGDIINREPHKCSELTWFNVDALPPNTIPYIRHAITEVLQGRIYSEFGWSQSNSSQC